MPVRIIRPAFLLPLTLLLLPLVLLSGTAVGQTSTASATLLWTAPGDDGLLGRASQYDLRISATPISASDTLSWWNAATVVSMAGKVPALSGTTDSMQVTGLAPATRYYAIIRAADEVLNWSGFSNVAAIDTRDAIAPLRISDLRVR